MPIRYAWKSSSQDGPVPFWPNRLKIEDSCRASTARGRPQHQRLPEPRTPLYQVFAVVDGSTPSRCVKTLFRPTPRLYSALSSKGHRCSHSGSETI
jgi:hypothetical protein